MSTGKCKHGEFDLVKGCPKCVAEYHSLGRTGDPLPFISSTTGDDLPKWPSPDTIPTADIADNAVVALRPGEDAEAHDYYLQAAEWLESAERAHISTTEDLRVSTDFLSRIGKLKRAMAAKKTEKQAPLKAEMDAIRETYDYLMTPILEADKIIRAKMLAFDAEQRRIRAEQEEINRLKREAAAKEKELNGEAEAVELVSVIKEPEKSTFTATGGAGTTDHWKHEVVDFAALPDAYKMVDTAMLSAIAKKWHDQKEIPGVRFFNQPIISVRG